MPFKRKVRTALEGVLPRPLLSRLYSAVSGRWDARVAGQSSGQIFSAIYRESKWGESSTGEFYSGSGSHASELVASYVKAVTEFCASFPTPPSVADLGCGDFNIGRYVRPYCGQYVACDVVPDLIEQNRDRFGALGVDFRCLDIVDDPLPDADVAFLRQVLQHLDNEKIAAVVRQLNRFIFAIITEHLPAKSGFVPNTAKPTGIRTRVSSGSGVVLTKSPFDLAVKSETILCSIKRTIGGKDGFITTTLYELPRPPVASQQSQ
jgi:SAM-dependent methyltransferase